MRDDVRRLQEKFAAFAADTRADRQRLAALAKAPGGQGITAGLQAAGLVPVLAALDSVGAAPADESMFARIRREVTAKQMPSDAAIPLETRLKMQGQ